MAANLSPKNWIAIGAASALSLGVMAGGAVTAANAMPLFTSDGDRTGATSADVKGTGGADVTFRVSSDSIVSPSPTSPVSVNSPNTVSPISPVSAQSPISAVSVDVDSPPSPVSLPSPPSAPSPASIASPASWSPPSVDSVD